MTSLQTFFLFEMVLLKSEGIVAVNNNLWVPISV